MQNRPLQSAWENEQARLFIAFCAALLVFWLYFASFVYWTSWILYWLWMMIDFPRIHVWVGGKINLLAGLANNSQDVSFAEWLEVMNQTASVLLLFLVPLVVLSGVALAHHPVLPFRSRRLVNISTLPGLLSKFAPSVIPVMAAAGPDGLMNDTSPENAWALKPEEFAEQHNLIKNRELDWGAAEACFAAQLGERMTNLSNWRPYERALFAVFGLQVFLDDRQAATQLLDDLNRSCMIKGLLRRKQHTYTPVYALSDRAFSRLATAPGVNEWLNAHSTVRTALVGLYGRDLRLPPARFRWLKGVDRTLWYALHTADTAKVFVEGSGVVAQARAETQAEQFGLPRPGVMIREAVKGLQVDLESIGLLHEQEVATAISRDRSEQTVIENAYSVHVVQEEQ